MYHPYTVVIDSLSLSVLQIQAWKSCWLSRKDLLGIHLIAQAAAQTCNKGARRLAFTPVNCYAGMGQGRREAQADRLIVGRPYRGETGAVLPS